MLGDRAHPTALIGGAFARTKSKIVAHLPPVFETLRVDQFSGQQFVRERPFTKTSSLGAALWSCASSARACFSASSMSFFQPYS